MMKGDNFKLGTILDYFWGKSVFFPKCSPNDYFCQNGKNTYVFLKKNDMNTHFLPVQKCTMVYQCICTWDAIIPSWISI